MSRGMSVVPDDNDGVRASSTAKTLISLVITIILLQPALPLLRRMPTGLEWFQLVGVIALVVLIIWRINVTDARPEHTPWLALLVILALAITLFVIGGLSWLATLAVAAAICGRFSRTPILAAAGAAACVVAGLVVALVHHDQSGDIFSVLVTAPLAALFAYSVARRMDTMSMLRRTRAELARAAVAEERLRIARDLHDLLGHSLSLITLKAELAGRVIGADPGRAAREIAELESVARQSLSDVREAVAGFRQPDLAGELAAARQLLDAAGIDSQITSTDAGQLPQDVDAALAWAVREGTTNIVRHSRATHVAIRVSTGPAAATAEITDNGPPVPAELEPAATAAAPTHGPAGRVAASKARPVFSGSGLAGLAERVRSLGGELAAGTVEPQGFRLRVVVPLPRPA
jgi:two-component system, NarL family, sensor histidine kinase DesK